MKNILGKINENAYWVFILALPTAWGIIKPIVETISSGTNLLASFKGFDWFSALFQIVTVVILFYVWRSFIQLKRQAIEAEKKTKELRDDLEVKMIVFSHIVNVRGRRLFIKSFENVQYFRLPNETDDQLWQRLPEGGLFNQHLFEEFTVVRKDLINHFKDASANEIAKLLEEYYPKEFIESPVT